MAKRLIRWQLPGGKAGCWVQVTSPPPSHLPSESVHAGRKQRIKELKVANNDQEEKSMATILEALEISIQKRYPKASSMYVCRYAYRLYATRGYPSLLGLLLKALEALNMAVRFLRSSCQPSVTCSFNKSKLCLQEKGGPSHCSDPQPLMALPNILGTELSSVASTEPH